MREWMVCKVENGIECLELHETKKSAETGAHDNSLRVSSAFIVVRGPEWKPISVYIEGVRYTPT